MEFVWTAARRVRLAERQQHLALRAELEHLMALVAAAEPVGHPDIAVAVDMQAMGEQQQARAEALQQLAGAVEFEDRVKRRAVAGKWPRRIDARWRARFAAAFADPDAG